MTKPASKPGRMQAAAKPAEGVSIPELLWNMAKAQPGIRTDELIAKAVEAGVNRASISTNISKMAGSRKLLRITGTGRSADGRQVDAFEAVGESYPRRLSYAIPAPAPAPKGRSAMQTVWQVLKDSELPLFAGEVKKAAAPLGVKPASVDQFLHALCKRGAARVVDRLPLKGLPKPAARYTAVGDAYPGAASEASPLPPPAPSLPPPPPPEPAALPTQPGEQHEQTRKRRSAHRVFWAQEEIEALCRKLARDHVRLGYPLSSKRLAHVAAEEGHGYRPRELAGVPQRDEFLKVQGGLIESLVQEEREAKRQEEQQAKAPAKPPAPTSAPAPANPTGASLAQPSAPFVALAAAIEHALTFTVQANLERILNARIGELEAQLGKALQPIVQMVADQQARDRVRQLVGLSPANGHANGEGARVLVSLPAVDTPPTEPHAKAPQVLIVNALPAQFESVKRAYPDLDLRLIQNRMPAEPDPDLVISLTKFMSHPLDRGLRKRYGERYCPVNGAADSVKLAIHRRLSVQPAQPLH